MKSMTVNVGASKANKACAKKHKKFFAKANSGKKISVRALVQKQVAV